MLNTILKRPKIPNGSVLGKLVYNDAQDIQQHLMMYAGGAANLIYFK